MDKAIELLRVKGQAKAAKRGERAASEGVVSSYMHPNGKIGALVEVDCETDFVARNERLRGVRPRGGVARGRRARLYVSEDEVPEDERREAELRVFTEQAAGEGKPEHVQEKIAEGRMRSGSRRSSCSTSATSTPTSTTGKTIEELRAELAANTGENVVIRRFARFQIGE